MSVLIEERGKRYEYYVQALRGQFGGDLATLIYETNKEVFLARKNQTDWFQSIPLNRIKPGHFYLINYNFNGNKLYCPILAIDYRVSEHNKHNLFAINLDYLPFDYKMLYFNAMYDSAINVFESNADIRTVLEEFPIPVNFENIYRSLENNGGFQFAITAFDITKIKECFVVSTNLMYVITNVHMRPINIALMKEQAQHYDEGIESKIRLDNLIQKLDEMSETYDNDVKEYYKKLSNLEKSYKLFTE